MNIDRLLKEKRTVADRILEMPRRVFTLRDNYRGQQDVLGMVMEPFESSSVAFQDCFDECVFYALIFECRLDTWPLWSMTLLLGLSLGTSGAIWTVSSPKQQQQLRRSLTTRMAGSRSYPLTAFMCHMDSGTFIHVFIYFICTFI